jgi:hypothetical protein
MYVILSDRWMLRRTTHEVWTPEGWRPIDTLHLGDELRGPSGRFVKVVGFT